ncbi:MAG TPA: VWA domain-containing protein [Patescibacteria group bacterium]|nr:VWA domain-containing protein [Patescibacteria group bacterium]
MPILMLCLLAVFSGMQAQPATPSASGWTLRLVAPDPLYLVGRTRVVAVALDPSGKPFEKISWMNLSLDGRELGADSRPPYEWEVDVGAALDRHRLELTAVARDGGRSTLSVLSPSYPFVDAVGVNLVLVPAVVRVGGRAVTGLTSSDFTLLEDGVAQTITSFSSEPMPASIAVALDNSGSMEGQLWSAQKAIAGFLQTQPGWTSLAFMTFNDQVFLEQDFTFEARLIATAVAAARVDGTRTALYEAVRIGSMYLGKRPGARVLLIFTDGEDTEHEGEGAEASQGRLRRSIDAAQAADITVFALAYGNAGTGSGGAALKQMTEQTGGEVATARSASELREAFARIGESIGSRYLLGYEPPQPKKTGYRAIELRVSRSGAEVFARRGYVMR